MNYYRDWKKLAAYIVLLAAESTINPYPPWVSESFLTPSESLDSDLSGLHLNTRQLKTILTTPPFFSSTSLVLFMSGESSSIRPATPVNGLKLSKMKSLWVLHSATRVNLTLPCWLSHTGDPLIHHGWHFGRMVHAMCNVQVLIINGFLRVSEADGEVQEKTLTYEFIPELLSLSFTYILWVQG